MKPSRSAIESGAAAALPLDIVVSGKWSAF
jgi:hypothetical protein